jgi:hypothetical protein
MMLLNYAKIIVPFVKNARRHEKRNCDLAVEEQSTEQRHSNVPMLAATLVGNLFT